MDVRITGANDLLALRKRLKEAGEKDLWREFTKQIRAAGRPVVADVKRNALETLPHRGGLAADVARRTRFSTRVKTSPKHPSVTFEARADRNIRRLNQGSLRHPLFGDREHWYTQSVEPGWFDQPIEDKADEFRRAALAAMRATASKVERHRL